MAKNASLSEVKDITKKLVTEDAKRASFTEPPAIGNSANIKDGTEIRTRQYAESFDPNGDNPFADPEVAERYAMIYEKAQYECRHFFDPTFIWTPQEEKILVRKLDWHVCLWACVMFFALQVDRGNLVQAVSDNMLDDLKLTTNNYNMGNTIFRIWRWLFLIEGQITLLVGLASFFKMPASAVETKTWFRPKGWFTDREVRIVVNRVLRDDPSKGDMHNRQAITLRRLWNAACDFDLWPLYIIGLLVYTPMVPVSDYITLTLKSVRFSTFTTNLLTIPYNVGHIIFLLLLTQLSERLNERSLVSMIQNIWILPCVIALRFWPGTMTNAWGTYAVVTVLLSYPYCHAILVAWVSKNSNDVGTRSVSTAFYNMCVQLGSVIGNNIYRADDKPKYRRGNTSLLIINILGIFLFLFTKAYYIFRNKQRDRKWVAMTEEQRQDYLNNSKEIGSKRLDFRFAH